MAKSRKISQDIISDEEYNSMSIEAQLIFIRLLAVSDDCGVVPAGEYTLNTIIAPPEKLRSRIMSIVDEIVSAGLGKIIEYKGKRYFLFKPKSFQEHQSYIFNKRHKSEYLKITAEEFDSLNLYEPNGLQLKDNCDSIDEQLGPNCEAMGGTRYKVQGTRIKVQGTEGGGKNEIVEIPEKLNTPDFVKTFDEFKLHRKMMKKPVSALAERKILTRIAECDVGTAIKMLNQSIEHGWQGIFELKGNTNARNSGGNNGGNGSGGVKPPPGKYDRFSTPATVG